MKTSVPSIEPLEARIAPAATMFATDVDGDFVTITTSKGSLVELRAALQPFIVAAGDPQLGGFLLTKIDLSTNAIFEGTDVTVTATPQLHDPDGDGVSTKYGDGLVNIGRIDATSADGGVALNLGKVSIDGDLGAIDAGTYSGTVLAIKSLSVYSLGEAREAALNSAFTSTVLGSMGPLTTKANLTGVYLDVRNKLASLTVGGSLVGLGTNSSGFIEAGSIGNVTIKGDLVALVADTNNAAASRSGYIFAYGDIGNVTVGGSVIGGDAGFSGRIFSQGEIGHVSIKGSLVGGTGEYSGQISSRDGIGNVTIGGSILGDSGFGSGSITSRDTGAKIGAVKIGGEVIGQGANESASIFAATTIASVSIGKSLTGYAYGQDARIDAGTSIPGGIKIGGAATNAKLSATQSMGAVSIGGDFENSELRTGTLKTVKIVGDLEGGSAAGRLYYSQATSITIGGSVRGGSATDTGTIYSLGNTGSISIAGDVLASRNDADSTGSITVYGTLGNLKIGGDLKGAAGNRTGFVYANVLKTATIGGDIIGGYYTSDDSLADSGSVYGVQIGSITVGGSVYSGPNLDESYVVRSGAITAVYTIGSVVIKGSLVGAHESHATIFAGGVSGNPVANNVAIKSISIGGMVKNAWIFAGVNADGVANSGNAQIGTVTVGGDWIASSMSAGASSNDGIIGNGNDTAYAGGTGSKIASIVIKGQVRGDDTSTTYGFMAHTIGSFKYSGITMPLKAGPANDLLASGSGLAVGPSRSPALAGKPDVYAVHVFEV